MGSASQLEQTWQAALEELERTISPVSFDTWVKGAAVVSHRGDRFTIEVANSFAKEWIEGRLRSEIEATLSRLLGSPTQLAVARRGVTSSEIGEPRPNSTGRARR